MQHPSLHDNFVYAYSVLADRCQIVLHAEYRDSPPVEYTDVVFAEVVAHYFECSLQGNVLFEICEEDLKTVLDEYAWLFDRLENYGWPEVPYRDRPELYRILLERRIRAYRVRSSYGLDGFVLCSGIEYAKRETKTCPGIET